MATTKATAKTPKAGVKPTKAGNAPKEYKPKHFTCLEYSEKAIAIHGINTKRITNELKSFGGRFNRYLSCGAGWIFPKEQFLKDLADNDMTLSGLLESLDNFIAEDMEKNPTIEIAGATNVSKASKALAAFKKA